MQACNTRHTQTYIYVFAQTYALFHQIIVSKSLSISLYFHRYFRPDDNGTDASSPSTTPPPDCCCIAAAVATAVAEEPLRLPRNSSDTNCADTSLVTVFRVNVSTYSM